MPLSRRTLLKGLAATATGLLLPADVAAEPERRVWAFPTNPLGGRGARATFTMTDEAGFLETGWFDSSLPSLDKHFTGGTFTLTFNGQEPNTLTFNASAADIVRAVDNNEVCWVLPVGTQPMDVLQVENEIVLWTGDRIVRGLGGTAMVPHRSGATIEIVGVAAEIDGAAYYGHGKGVWRTQLD